MRNTKALGFELIALGLAIATAATLGPLVMNVIRYRTSDTGLNQIAGGDAAALLLVAPACLAVGILALRGHRAAPALALAPGVFAVYTYTQLIAGEEYSGRPGNNERFFPLLWAAFVLGGAVAVTAWRAVRRAAPPAPSPRLRHVAAATLFAVVLLLAAQHLPTLADAVRDHPASPGYLSAPTAFWLVKLMDLGLVVPAALATGTGLARRAGWAEAPMYAIVGAYALLGSSVTGMAVVMLARDDPDASVAFALGFGVLTLVFAGLAVAVYRPLFAGGPGVRPRSAVARPAGPHAA